MTKTMIDTTQRGLEAKIVEVKAHAKSRRGTGTSAGTAKPPNFDGTTSWAIFWHQFETVAKHNCWATNVLHEDPKGATYDETLEALDDRFGDHHLVTAYQSHLEARNQGVVKSCKTLP